MKPGIVFLDKDGTLVEDIPYNVDPQRMRLAPGVLDGLRYLHAAGCRLVVVTNQSGIARGYFSEGELAAVEKRLRQLLAQGNVPLDGFYYCPHHPSGVVPGYAIHCSCRKPEPGLILRAAADLQATDLSNSWMIGDILNDVECGKRAGVRTILIDNGNETEWEWTPLRQPEFTVQSFLEAAHIIVKGEWVLTDLPGLETRPTKMDGMS
jgi:D,D-heptose 1,7-bisphosphate phosphatase